MWMRLYTSKLLRMRRLGLPRACFCSNVDAALDATSNKPLSSVHTNAEIGKFSCVRPLLKHINNAEAKFTIAIQRIASRYAAFRQRCSQNRANSSCQSLLSSSHHWFADFRWLKATNVARVSLLLRLTPSFRHPSASATSYRRRILGRTPFWIRTIADDDSGNYSLSLLIFVHQHLLMY